jgi:hypothetical protein
MSEWVELEVDDEEEGDEREGDERGESAKSTALPSSFSSAPLRHLAKVSHRNEAAIASIMASMDALRTLANHHSEESAETFTSSPSLASLNQSLAAYVTRLKVQSRMASSRESIVRGAPASAADQVLQSIEALSTQTAAFETSFPKYVRQISAHTLSLTRNELSKARESVSVMANKAAVSRQQYENELQASTSGLVAEAKGRMVRAKDELLRSRVVQELVSDAGRILEMLGSNAEMGTDDTESQLAYAAESIISHLSTLKNVTMAQDVQREVECVRLAFGEFGSSLKAFVKGGANISSSHSSSSGSSSSASHSSSSPSISASHSSSSSSSGSSIPRRLLAQVTNPQRRMELSTMDPSKAASLLQHTREALTEMDPASTQYKKLKVVEEILVFRTSISGPARHSHSTGSISPLMSEKWQLQKTAVDAEFRRLMREVEIAMAAENKVLSARERTVAKATADLHKAALTHMHRVNAVVDEKLDVWRKDMARAYREGADKMLVSAQEFVSRVIAALEVFVSTGLGSRHHSHSRSQSQPHPRSQPHSRKATLSHFDFDDAEAVDEADEDADGGEGMDELSSLLRRMYELTLEVFGAWEKVAEMVLRVNRYGSARAVHKVTSTLEPIRAQFEGLVASCRGVSAAAARPGGEP